jgi:hypothetical protein
MNRIIVMNKSLNLWSRKLHRWLALPFVPLLLVVFFTRETPFGEVIQRVQGAFVIVLALTGAYLWLLPYLARRQRAK